VALDPRVHLLNAFHQVRDLLLAQSHHLRQPLAVEHEAFRPAVLAVHLHTLAEQLPLPEHALEGLPPGHHLHTAPAFQLALHAVAYL